MKVDRFLRIALALLIFIAFVVGIAAILFLTESALNVWDRLLQGPRWLLYAYVSSLIALSLLTAWLTWRLVVRRKISPVKPVVAVPTREEIEQRLRNAAGAGVNVADARAEMQELARRRATAGVHLCFFGEISTGKSSLIKALIPTADVKIDVVGGSTLDIRHYRWRGDGDQDIELTDVPGTGSSDSGFDRVAEEEAKRSHGVIFVCDSDLGRREVEALRALIGFGKPLVLVLNKADQYSHEEQAQIMQRLLERLDELGGALARDRVVAVTAGGSSEVVEQTDNGEMLAERPRDPNIGVLVVAINQLLAGDGALLDGALERAVFRLTADKLADAELVFRDQRAEQIIRSSTRKAVLGALAAVSPGTDVIIQGYIGTTMTRDLCALFGAAPRDLDIEEFLNLSQSRAGTALPLSLAVAGNGLKAFPGVGTVAGGLVHAVAYGLIFDALGRSLVSTLQRQGSLQPQKAAQAFEDELSEHIEAGVKRISRVALEQRDSKG